MSRRRKRPDELELIAYEGKLLEAYELERQLHHELYIRGMNCRPGHAGLESLAGITTPVGRDRPTIDIYIDQQRRRLDVLRLHMPLIEGSVADGLSSR
jgi:hypothetical protein